MFCFIPPSQFWIHNGHVLWQIVLCFDVKNNNNNVSIRGTSYSKRGQSWRLTYHGRILCYVDSIRQIVEMFRVPWQLVRTQTWNTKIFFHQLRDLNQTVHFRRLYYNILLYIHNIITRENYTIARTTSCRDIV